MKDFFIIVSGPTGVGKTDLVRDLANKLMFNVAIVNADMGQLYAPLSIGTAKPNIKNETISHYLFDILDMPINYTVADYRKKLINSMNELWSKNIVPIVVGGSGFYIKSIFFPQPVVNQMQAQKKQAYKNLNVQELWNRLNKVDPERAAMINHNDRYRLERALDIWEQTGQKPSNYKLTFDPPGYCAFIFLTRDRDDLYKRINKRVDVMLNSGWIEEVKSLDTSWHSFLIEKKLIGYPEIISYLQEPQGGLLVEEIAKKTRAYAKRQLTFWKSLSKMLHKADPDCRYIKYIDEVNLTLLDIDLYIGQLSDKLNNIYNSLK